MSFMCGNALLFTTAINDNNAAFLDGSTAACVEFATIPLDLTLWHCRLAHHHHGDVKRLIQRDLVTGLTLDFKAVPDPVCEPCLSGKSPPSCHGMYKARLWTQFRRQLVKIDILFNTLLQVDKPPAAVLLSHITLGYYKKGYT
ncbi:hypothetical protein SERLADRAFT_432182 [Serpula lacrymans var. lacrymans S7.9]|uniref:GAG-pre-integrase domain-containing protein n=1 Tax=Serpula lacrymans var. lacrymans (strain S7.9) TaxID=578457 RepID=F8NEH4_SERL9|nr:uncharacterized protein SERLADRAFT_432182 [Serpula lacrymans var. lacrymans S7.9]EGO30608.1 hypothetical protein SERLADRAFT_432182 [Serpula lacrymans var. lacrymans S7.9]